MSYEKLIQTGLALLHEADMVAREGFAVYIHVEGFSPIQVREVEALQESTVIARVRSWADEDTEAELWIVPITAVRGVQMRDR